MCNNMVTLNYDCLWLVMEESYNQDHVNMSKAFGIPIMSKNISKDFLNDNILSFPFDFIKKRTSDVNWSCVGNFIREFKANLDWEDIFL
jgi:hypothetical protein